MGPAGGNRGGLIVAEGTPEEVAAVPESFTGEFLRPLVGVTATARAKPKRARSRRA
jgi:excinuclease ABC subunit A